MKKTQTHLSHSLEDTKRLANEFSKSLKPGAVITLGGPLGSGKTTFIKLLAESLKVSDPVTSPSFTLHQTYFSPQLACSIHHLDLYRLTSLSTETGQLIHHLIFQTDSLVLIEWPEIIKKDLPPQVINLIFSIIGPSSRQISIKY